VKQITKGGDSSGGSEPVASDDVGGSAFPVAAGVVLAAPGAPPIAASLRRVFCSPLAVKVQPAKEQLGEGVGVVAIVASHHFFQVLPGVTPLSGGRKV
jgi:hypothetical protein